MPIVIGRTLKEMVKDVSRLVQFTLLRSVNKSPPDPVIAAIRSKPIATGNDVLPSADVNAPSEIHPSHHIAPGPRSNTVLVKGDSLDGLLRQKLSS